LGLQADDGPSGDRPIADIATLDGAGPEHLAFHIGKTPGFAQSRAGFCLVDASARVRDHPSGMTLLRCASAQQAFAAAAHLFYPDYAKTVWATGTPIDPTARVAAGVELALGVVIGPGAEIGERTRIGPNAVIGRGVAIGRDCEIGANVTLGCALIGDRVHILPGAQIGQSGFGFVPGQSGHDRIPQLGRVVVQDDVEIGACTTVDRGALGDTVIGEGTKIDNLVQIGHNTRIGRHSIIVSQVGISGSCEIGDFVVLGGQVGVADHVRIGDARIAAKSGVPPGVFAGGTDYGGYPVRLMKDWRRELAAVVLLAKRRKQDR
jgi:UDP-3-O-[3-hydroxymyristoyl] glucosamine N-acyltransferase